MSELTTGQIVKIVIAVLVLVVVLSGVYLVFKDSIISYFTGFAPAHEVDTTTAFGKELVQDKNIIATYSLFDSSARILLVGPPPVTTEYYFKKKTDLLKKDVKWLSSFSLRGAFGADQDVGVIDGSGKVAVKPEFLSDATLQKIQGSYRYKGGLYVLQ